jgi:cell division initiation protein
METKALSSQLSPTEIKNKDFKKTMLGYSPEEVVGFLDSVAKLWEKIQKKEKDLLSTISQLEGEISNWEKRKGELEQIKEAAIAEAKTIIESAEERSNQIRKNTENWLATVLQEVEEVERRKKNFVTAFRSALETHYEILKTEESKNESLSLRLNEYLRS